MNIVYYLYRDRRYVFLMYMYNDKNPNKKISKFTIKSQVDKL